MQKVVRLFEDEATLQFEKETLGSLGELVVRPSTTEEEVIENSKDADFIIVGYEPITARVLEQLPNLKMVTFRSIGFNGIDIQKANELQLPVSNITKYCIEEVANYVSSAILAHNRRLIDFNQSVKVDKKWDYLLFPEMRRLSLLTVGLIGFGNIPRLVAQRLVPFGCRIIAYDPFVDESVFQEYGVEKVSMDEIYQRADYISSHLPLNKETSEIINKSKFDQIKESAVFINSSRGGVVNETDLLNALEEGKISYAILDVLQDEYPNLETNPFVSMPNVVLTPHIAFYSQDAWEQSARDAMMNIVHFIREEYDQIELVNRKHAKFKVLAK